VPFGYTTFSVPNIPEPATLALLALGAGAALRGRRRSLENELGKKYLREANIDF
jgi:hypothetical protein